MFDRTSAEPLPRLLGVLALLGAVALPGTAAACLDLGSFCDETIGWTDAELLNGASVPTDGVLVGPGRS